MKKSLLERKQLVIFGAGYFGKKWLAYFRELGLDVKCFIDNSVEKQGKLVDGIQILEPRVIVGNKNDYLFVVAIYNTPGII